MTEELKMIKDMYGEKMMQICRRNFSTLLEIPGALFEILSKQFAPSHTLADDILSRYLEEDFKNYILSFTKKEEKEEIDTGKNPFELMKEAGYTLYACRDEDDIQSFKHFYKPGEQLCTFNGGRLLRCLVFFAVKDNARELNRDDFKEPKREDAYGTSVISIQFARGAYNTLSIKNRYNHTVNNPDATFYNNLENIIPGLTKSFENAYRLRIVSETGSNNSYFISDIPYTMGYIPPRDEEGKEIEVDDKKKLDRKYYRFNFEDNGIYYCENNIIIKDGKVIDDYCKDKGRYILADNYIIDTHEKTIFPFVYIEDEEKKKAKEEKKEIKPKDDSFTRSIKEVGEIKNITLQKDNGNRIIKFKYTNGKEVFVTIDRTNSIIGYTNEHIKKLYEGFLSKNRLLKQLSVDNVEIVEEGCLVHNAAMEELSLPNAKYLGRYFFNRAVFIRKVYIPNVLEIADNAFEYNRKIEVFEAPSVEKIGVRVLYNNKALTKLLLPNVKWIGESFVAANEGHWKIIYMPKLLRLDTECFHQLRSVDVVNMDSVEEIGPWVFFCEEELRELNLPNVIDIYDGFMDSNHLMEYFSAPQLKNFAENSFSNHERMRNEIIKCIKNKQPCEVCVSPKEGMII